MTSQIKDKGYTYTWIYVDTCAKESQQYTEIKFIKTFTSIITCQRSYIRFYYIYITDFFLYNTRSFLEYILFTLVVPNPWPYGFENNDFCEAHKALTYHKEQKYESYKKKNI